MRRTIRTWLTLATVVATIAALSVTPAFAAGEFNFADGNLPGVIATEGSSGTTTMTYTVEYSGAITDSVSVEWQVVTDGFEADIDDFTGDSLPGGTLDFTATDSEEISIEVDTDTDPELDDTFRVVLRNTTGDATIGNDGEALGVILDDDPVTATVSDPSSAIDEGGTASFDVSLDAPHEDTAVTVSWRTVDGTATAGQDYDAVTNGTVTIPQGNTDETISVNVRDDDVDEGDIDEDFHVELTGVTDGEVDSGDGGRATAQITDADGSARLLYVSDVEVTEGGTADFVVSLSENAPTTGVEFDASLIDNTTQGSNDYDTTADDGSFSISDGSPSTTVSVDITGDSSAEPTETFSLQIDEVTSGNAQIDDGVGTATILDDDGPNASLHPSTDAVEDITVTEGGTAQLTVELSSSAGSSGATVDWVVIPDRASLGDVADSGGTVSFADGEASKTISIPTVQDDTHEHAETLRVRLLDAQRATLGSPSEQVVTIWDDDAPPTVRVSDAEVLEGDSGITKARLDLELDRPSDETARVHWQTTPGNLEEGDRNATHEDGDYTHVAAGDGEVTIPAGQTTATLTVDIHGDTDDEENEIFFVLLNDVLTVDATVPDTDAGGRATVTIVNDDGPRFVVSDAAGLEGGSDSSGSAVFEVTLLGNDPFTCDVIRDCPSVDRPYVVQYATQRGEGEDGATPSNAEHVDDVDYVHTTGELSFAPGEARTKEVTVPFVGDRFAEHSEWFTLEIALTDDAANDFATIQDGTGLGTVVNDDGPRLTIADVEVAEGDSGTSTATLTVTLEDDRDGEAAGRTIRADWRTKEVPGAPSPADAGGDFQTSSGTVELPDGVDQAFIQVPVHGDTVNEPNEVFEVRLSKPDFARIADGTGVVTIVDDDGPQLDVGDTTVTEGTDSTVNAAVQVTLSAASGSEVTVDYATADGTATAGLDYQPVSGTLTFPAGATSRTISVPVLPDDADEPDETFTVHLSNAAGAPIGRDTGTVTIHDDLLDDGGGGGGGEGDTGEVFRSAGEHRIATSVAVSADHWDSAEAVTIATAWAFPDALAGGALSAGLGGPLLLTDADDLSAIVADEIDRLGASEAWILGGPAAVGPDVEQELEDRGLKVFRLAGADRFETAAEIVRAVRLPPSGEVMLALGAHPDDSRAWPDALSAGSLTASSDQVPTLLTRSDDLPAATEEALAELGAQRVRVLGGAAAIDDAVVQRLEDLGYEVDRLAGASRYATSVAVAGDALQRQSDGDVVLVFATGQNFPDGLSAGALAARFRALVVLVPPDDLAHAPEVQAFLQEHADRFDQGVIVGGSAVVSEDVRAQLAQAMKAD